MDVEDIIKGLLGESVRRSVAEWRFLVVMVVFCLRNEAGLNRTFELPPRQHLIGKSELTVQANSRGDPS